MESIYIEPRMQQQQQQHRRGQQNMRYNSIDNRLLASAYDLTANTYSNTNLLVVPRHYQQADNQLVQLQPQLIQSQPPLLPLPNTARPRHTMSLPGRIYTGSGQLNRAAKKPKSQDHSASNSKNNYQKTKGANYTAPCVKEQLISKKMTHPDRQNTNAKEQLVSDLVFPLSPHPSSLPLPKFFMRQRAAKLSCKAEAKVGGTCSTEGFRRVFQLQ